jgi:hypothetical protein
MQQQGLQPPGHEAHLHQRVFRRHGRGFALALGSAVQPLALQPYRHFFGIAMRHIHQALALLRRQDVMPLLQQQKAILGIDINRELLPTRKNCREV